ncbi:hypothetical protein CR513_01168, partial [Mucuna pruriens]
MFDFVSRHGLGFKPPPYHEIREVNNNNTLNALEAHRAEWKKTRCTIMTDGWTDKRRRTILNFLVNSPKGTIFLKSIDAFAISETTENIF